MGLLRKLAYLVVRDARDRRTAVSLMLLMTAASALEAVSVGLIMPFVALIQDQHVASRSRVFLIFRSLCGGIENEADVVFSFGAMLVAVFLIKNAFGLLVQWRQLRFIFRRHVALTERLVERYFGNDYAFHLQHNSSELIQNVIAQTHLVSSHTLVSVFTIVVEGLTVVVILALMVALQPLLVPIVGAVVGIVGLLLYRSVRHSSYRLGVEAKGHQERMIRSLQQGLGGIKEVKMRGVERFFLRGVSDGAVGFGRADEHHRLVMVIPRYALESLGMVALVTISLGMIARHQPPAVVLPVLGVLALAAVRLLPSASRIVASLTDIRHNTAPVEAIYAALKSPSPFEGLAATVVRPLQLKAELRLKHVGYRYPGATTLALEDINLTIRRGESIAIVGGSGAGKTTLADVIIGLLAPSAGEIEVDGMPLAGELRYAWRRSVGYIPQQVYLSDDSILRNVAFGMEDASIDRPRVESALATASLTDVVSALPDGLDSSVGEDGARLSGGQRQRIGIARALYLEPQLLVLDEATSALDGRTERDIVESIEQLRNERTVVVIAHRLSTIRSCDRICFLRGGRLLQVGSWEEVHASNAEFRELAALARSDLSATRSVSVEDEQTA